MKNLEIYLRESQAELMVECGAFFAFSRAHADNMAVEGLEYTQLPSGVFCPKLSAFKWVRGFELLREVAIKKDLEENGVKSIIWRELENFECERTGDICDTVEPLKEYGITEAEIRYQYEFYCQHCIDKQYF